MLLELHIRDFAIIDDLRVAFEPGLNVLTGETGAGKSIIIDALGAVLGERLGADVVRTGAKAAHVDAMFDIDCLPARAQIIALLDDLGIEPDDDQLILSREIAAGGRSVSRINGRASTAGALSRLGGLLVDIHGQSDHLSLLHKSAHLDVLDRYAGTSELREQVALTVRAIREVRRTIEDLTSGERERERRVDLLSFQVEEIGAARIAPGEEESLRVQRDILANAERLAAAAARVYEMLTGGDGDLSVGSSPADALRLAADQAGEISEIDRSISDSAERLRDASIVVEEIAREIRDYRERVEADPVRLEEIEERLDLIQRLKRKYGDTIADVLAFAAAAEAELKSLTGPERDASTLRQREQELLAHLAAEAAALSAERSAAASTLSTSVEAAIAELNMGRARFAVSIEHRPSAAGVSVPLLGNPVEFDETGIDRVEFLLASNSGEAPKPIARVASGGEMARLMLALKSVLSAADSTPTLVFDEVDAGVGGRSGQIVGEKLWALTSGHQVLVITHLAQIAAFAESHLKISKAELDGRTISSVRTVHGDERVDELAAMLDGLPPSPASRENARTMEARINGWKREHAGLVKAARA